MMEVLIRADAYAEIGAGHVMRCLALAHALKGRGAGVVFIGRIDSGLMRRRIIAEGFELISLDEIWPSARDLEVMTGVINESAKAPLVVLDGYRFDQSYQGAVRALGVKTLVIDDMCHQPAYCADLILNQNIYAPGMIYPNIEAGRLLLGTDYAMIRPEFLARAGGETASVPERARRVLVCFGGGDPDKVTGLAVAALLRTGIEDLAVQVVIGPMNDQAAEIRSLLTAAPFSVELLSGIDDMSTIISRTDLALVAGGSICWELALFGVPGLVLITAGNQSAVAAGVDRAGMLENCGWFHNLRVGEFAGRITELITDHRRRREMAATGREKVDGRGAARVAEELLAAA